MRPYRREKVASLVRDVVSETIAHGLNDPRIRPFTTTVTRVEMTRDLLIAKVYISVLGGGAAERKTMLGIQHAAGHIQRQVAAAVRMRQCPQLRFMVDESVKAARETLSILEENRRRNPELYTDLDDPERNDEVDDEGRTDPDDSMNDRPEGDGA
jgi:ribosome-binding factor A